MKQTLLAAAFLAASSCGATAQNLDGNTLLEACEAPETDGLYFFCTGYILGIVEGIKWGASVTVVASGTKVETAELNGLTDFMLGYCSPPEAELRQHLDIVVNFLVTHPERRHESARGLALDAFREAFPCPA